MIEPNPVFGDLTRFHLAREIERWGWSVGAHSDGHPRVLEPEAARLRIGRFCAIGPNVALALGNHCTDLVTTYPFKALAAFWPTAAAGADDHASRGDIVLGDEVWLGANCTVLSGVTIGSGAVVRRDVPPCAIVTGNPATLLRHRFDGATIERLLRVCWWAWPDARIAEYLPLILGTDIEAFLGRAEASSGEAATPAEPARRTTRKPVRRRTARRAG